MMNTFLQLSFLLPRLPKLASTGTNQNILKQIQQTIDVLVWFSNGFYVSLRVYIFQIPPFKLPYCICLHKLELFLSI